jgi:hypothetical protein
MRGAWLALLALCLPACGNRETRDASLRDSVARQFAADCRRTRAPNAEQAQVLERLCTCAVGRIRSGDIAFGDSDAAVSEKIGRAQNLCLREVYGGEAGSGNASR